MSTDIIIKSVTEKLPDILLAIGIFFVFWLIGTIFKTMAKKLLDEKSPHKNISRVISGIIKNIMLIILIFGMSYLSIKLLRQIDFLTH